MGRHDKRKADTADKQAKDGPQKPTQKKGGKWMGPSMVRYFNENREESNKRRDIIRHARRHPLDSQAMAWLKKNLSDHDFSGVVLKIGTDWLYKL